MLNSKSQMQKQGWIISSFSFWGGGGFCVWCTLFRKRLTKGNREKTSKTPADEAEASFVGEDICSRKVSFGCFVFLSRQENRCLSTLSQGHHD